MFATEKELKTDHEINFGSCWWCFSVFVNVQQCLPLCVFFRVVGRQRLLSKESKVDLASGNSNTNIAETLSCSRFFMCVQLNLTQNYSISYLTQNVKSVIVFQFHYTLQNTKDKMGVKTCKSWIPEKPPKSANWLFWRFYVATLAILWDCMNQLWHFDTFYKT